MVKIPILTRHVISTSTGAEPGEEDEEEEEKRRRRAQIALMKKVRSTNQRATQRWCMTPVALHHVTHHMTNHCMVAPLLPPQVNRAMPHYAEKGGHGALFDMTAVAKAALEEEKKTKTEGCLVSGSVQGSNDVSRKDLVS